MSPFKASHPLSLKQILSFFGIQSSGYRPKSLHKDLMLGGVHGFDSVLLGYASAALIFTGSLVTYLPFAIAVAIAGSAAVLLVIALASKIPIGFAWSEERAVAILVTVAVMMNADMARFVSGDAAAATMFTIMALTSLALGIAFLVVARFDLAPLVQLIPFPVVCGFLAGAGWLVFSAGVGLTTGHEVEISPELFHHVLSREALIHWMPALVCAVGIFTLLKIKHHLLILPLSLLACTAGFFAVAYWQGTSLESLRAGEWIFDLPKDAVTKGIASLDFTHVNWSFVVEALPFVGTILLISLASSFFSLSALELEIGTPIEFNHELKNQGIASIASAACLSLPGAFSLDATVTSKHMGGTSRWIALLAFVICIIAAVDHGSLIEFIPKMVVATLVFVFALEQMQKYLIKAPGQMKRPDAVTVWMIFAVIVVFGIIPGVQLGIIATTIVFIMRYSKTEIVGSSYTLSEIASSVERAIGHRNLLKESGEHVRIFNLQGFLFFGTVNPYFDRMKEVCKQSRGETYFIFNFKRVSGIDSTAVQVFHKILNLLKSKSITAVFCDLGEDTEKAFDLAGKLSARNCIVLENIDLALKWVEERLLEEHHLEAGSRSMEEMLEEMLGNREKAEELASTMELVKLGEGEYLFRQGDHEASAYLIHSGTIEIRLEAEGGKHIRLREFRHGSVIGEMAAYSGNKERSASAIAIEPAVLYRLDVAKLAAMNATKSEAALHELVARLLAARIGFMNQRIHADL
jgi:SulP family sulfate permease